MWFYFLLSTFLASLLHLHRFSIGRGLVCFLSSARLAHSIAEGGFFSFLPWDSAFHLGRNHTNPFALGYQNTEAQSRSRILLSGKIVVQIQYFASEKVFSTLTRIYGLSFHYLRSEFLLHSGSVTLGQQHPPSRLSLLRSDRKFPKRQKKDKGMGIFHPVDLKRSQLFSFDAMLCSLDNRILL